MGDRTWARVTFRKEDEHFFEEELGDNPWEDIDEDDKVKNGFLGDVNYGGYDYWEGISNKGVLFHGQHGAGSDYGEHIFVSDGHEYLECASLEGLPVVAVEKDCEPPDLKYIKRYYTAVEKVERFFKGHRCRNK